MVNNTNLCVDLKTVMQNDALLKRDKTYHGVLTRDAEDHFLFEETLPAKSYHRNEKLYEGKYCSLVHKQSGKYQIHLKAMNANDIKQVSTIAFNIYSEIDNALKIIKK